MINPTPSYFNQHYPWPDEILTNFNPIEMVFSHDSDLEIDILWPYFSDSNFFAKLVDFLNVNIEKLTASFTVRIQEDNGSRNGLG